MTISTTANRTTTAGNDVTTAFDFNFNTSADVDVVVLLVNDATGVSVLQVDVTDYAITVPTADRADGVRVTMVTAPADGETLIIYRDTPLTQGLDLVENDPFPSAEAESAWDRAIMIAQRTRELVTRSFTLADGDTSDPSLVIPSPVAEQFMRWNAAGDALELVTLSAVGDPVVTTTFTADWLTAATAAIANTKLGLGTGDSPTFAGQTLTGSQIISSATPSQVMFETDASLDNKRWDVLADAEALNYRLLDDAFTAATPWLTVNRTGMTVDTINFRNGILQSDGKAVINASTAGRQVQVVNTQDGAVATGTTVMVYDDTIPQNTEGDEYMTLAITPTSATNKLKIDVVITLSNSNAGDALAISALFQDSTAGALAAMQQGRDQAANRRATISFTHFMTSGTTSSTTFKVRAGFESAGTTTFNGISGARRFGGVMASSMTITEIQV